MASTRERTVWQQIAERLGEAFYQGWGRIELLMGFPKPRSRRDSAALILSVVVHVLFLGYVATTVTPRYVLPHPIVEEPVPVELIPPPQPIIKIPPPPPPIPPKKIVERQEEPPPPKPTPPKPEPAPPQPAPPAPAPAPTPPRPEQKPTPPKPQPPKPSPLPAQVKETTDQPKPAPTKTAPAPTPTPRPQPAQQTTPTPAPPSPTPGPPKPNPNPVTSPSQLNVHAPAQEAPLSVPRLPMAPAGGQPGRPGSNQAGGGPAAGSPGANQPGGAQGSGLRPYPYGQMPSGGSGLRGTLVGCANADAVRLTTSERSRCNERFGASAAGAPPLDGIAARRGEFDRAAAANDAENRYRNATPTGTTESSSPSRGAGLGPVPRVGPN